MNSIERQLTEITDASAVDVRVTADAVVVGRLTVRDATVVDYYRSMEAARREDAARDAFTIGSRALAAAGGSATMAALDERLESAVTGASEQLAALPQTIRASIDALYGQYFGEHGEFAGRLGENLAAVGKQLGVEGETVAAIRDAIAADARKRVGEALEPIVQSLNVNDPNGPLGLMQRMLQEMQAGQVELRALVESTVRVREQRDLGVHKGYDLEAFVGSVLGELSSRLGDRFEDCSLTAGLVPKCKEGDFLALLDPQLTGTAESGIVIEAKNRKSDTVNSLCRLLDSARKNRGACVSIGVLTNPDVAAQPVAFYGRDKIVVHLPGFGTSEADAEHQAKLLELGYYAARMQAAALAGAQPRDAIDTGFLAQHLQRLSNTNKKFSTLRARLTGIETAVEATRECADGIRDEFDAAAGELREALVRQTAALKP